MKKQDETIIFKDGHINENGEFIVKFTRDEEFETADSLSGNMKDSKQRTKNGRDSNTNKSAISDEIKTKVDRKEESEFAKRLSGELDLATSEIVIDFNRIMKGVGDAVNKISKALERSNGTILTDNEKDVVEHYLLSGDIKDIDIFIAKTHYKNIEDYIDDVEFFKTYANIEDNEFMKLNKSDKMSIVYSVLTNIRTESSDFCRCLLDMVA